MDRYAPTPGPYAVVWFEDDNVYTLVDHSNHTVTLTPAEVSYEHMSILRDEKAVNDAEDDVRYAIPLSLLEDLFGVEAYVP